MYQPAPENAVRMECNRANHELLQSIAQYWIIDAKIFRVVDDILFDGLRCIPSDRSDSIPVRKGLARLSLKVGNLVFPLKPSFIPALISPSRWMRQTFVKHRLAITSESTILTTEEPPRPLAIFIPDLLNEWCGSTSFASSMSKQSV